jgi:hypothetical protein
MWQTTKIYGKKDVHVAGSLRLNTRPLRKMAVFWVVEPCSLVKVYQRFRGPCCLHHQGDSQARTTETLVNFYQTTRRYNPEDSHLRTHRRENLKSYTSAYWWRKTEVNLVHFLGTCARGSCHLQQIRKPFLGMAGRFRLTMDGTTLSRQDCSKKKKKDKTSWLAVVSTMNKQENSKVGHVLVTSFRQDVAWPRKCWGNVIFRNEVEDTWKRLWIHSCVKKRTAEDLISCFMTELWQDGKKFRNFPRMKPQTLVCCYLLQTSEWTVMTGHVSDASYLIRSAWAALFNSHSSAPDVNDAVWNSFVLFWLLSTRFQSTNTVYALYQHFTLILHWTFTPHTKEPELV